ncbi:MAG TPA: DUF4389 domain-containing protein [Nakamurella sp.]|nr:DUF4389 domain-containing protein [Nakamurella sp.]
MSATGTSYPVRVDAAVEPATSRGLWLIKWLLLIPHFVVLAFLWLGFVLFSIAAFFAILFTGHYPRALFDFNVGVLRWSWRVHYYGYAALGTDRYPPFTLAEVPDYPAHLDVPYPATLSRGLVLVKWWLLALPHYIVLALFVGGGIWFTTRAHTGNAWWDTSWGVGGLVGLLVLVAAVVLLFTGRYPRPLYDFVLGMDRWALRVAAYAALMTDAYPPFRLDMGGPDPGSVPAAWIGPSPHGPAQPWPQPPPAVQRTGWTAGRIVSVVVGSLLLFAATGTAIAGGGLLWTHYQQRDDGYLSSAEVAVSTGRYAVVTDSFRLEGAGLGWTVDNVLGTVRLQAEPVDADGELFLGIGPTEEVGRYLDQVGYTGLQHFGARWDGGLTATWTPVDHPGSAPAVPPARAGVWAASADGPGARSLTWRPAEGDWTIVIMRADAAPGVLARVQVGATLPGLAWIGAGLLGGGALLLVAGGLLVGVATRRASTSLTAGGAGPAGPDTGAMPALTGRPGW